MAYSTCCNAHTNYPDINLCPDCLEYCDWIEDETINPNNNESTDND